jgi:hypothetical protein
MFFKKVVWYFRLSHDHHHHHGHEEEKQSHWSTMGNSNNKQPLYSKDKYIYNTEQDPCQKHACEIQKCLQENNYNQTRVKKPKN